VDVLHVHLKGFKDEKRDYSKPRARLPFLLAHFLDQEHGGYFWKTDLAANP